MDDGFYWVDVDAPRLGSSLELYGIQGKLIAEWLEGSWYFTGCDVPIFENPSIIVISERLSPPEHPAVANGAAVVMIAGG